MKLQTIKSHVNTLQTKESNMDTPHKITELKKNSYQSCQNRPCASLTDMCFPLRHINRPCGEDEVDAHNVLSLLRSTVKHLCHAV